MQTGNGGAAGSIVYASLAEPLARGYAVANTDTGHQGGGGDFEWAVGHPEKLTDYAYRAVHELTVVGKAITTARYGKAPAESYWNGCSTGGRQGLKEAQRFPDDYDAIVAGAPASNWSPLMAFSIVVQRNMTGPGALGADKLPLLKEAAIAACDTLDGVADRVITNARAVQVRSGEPAVRRRQDRCVLERDRGRGRQAHLCRRREQGRRACCFRAPAPAASRSGPPTRRRSSRSARATSATWSRATPNWDPASFDVDADVARAEAQDGGASRAMDPDLSAFVAPRRQADHVPRHDGRPDPAPQLRELLRERRREARPESGRRRASRCISCRAWITARAARARLRSTGSARSRASIETGKAPAVLAGTHPAAPPGAPGAPRSRSLGRSAGTRRARGTRARGDTADAANWECAAE